MKNIAVISANKHKYSETFIHLQVKELPYNIHYCTGNYLPTSYALGFEGEDTPFLTSTPKNLLQKLWGSIEKHTPSTQDLRNAIRGYFEKNKIQLVIAQYGHSGIEMMPITTSLQLPLIVHFHGFDAYREDALTRNSALYTNMFKEAKACIAVSKDMREQLIRLGADPQKTHLIPYGIDYTQFSGSVTNSGKTATVFVSCGRFVEKKAPFHVLLAFKETLQAIPEAKLEMIGEGHLLESTKMLATTLGIQDSVTFHGILSPDEVAIVMGRSDLFVQHSMVTPSGDSEGAPLSVMEAGAAALPVISTRHKGIQEIVKDGVTGLLSSEGNVQEMAENMIKLGLNQELRTRMSQEAQLRIKENYSQEIYLGRLTQLINKFIL